MGLQGQRQRYINIVQLQWTIIKNILKLISLVDQPMRLNLLNIFQRSFNCQVIQIRKNQPKHKMYKHKIIVLYICSKYLHVLESSYLQVYFKYVQVCYNQ